MKLNRTTISLFVVFLVLTFGPTTAVANQLPSFNTADLVVEDRTITFNGWDLNDMGPGRFIVQANNWDEYQPIVAAFNDSLLFGRPTPWNNYAAFSGLNSTHFTQLLFNCTDEFGSIADLSVNSSSCLRESLKTAIASLLAFNESSETSLMPRSEENLLIPFLWDRSYTGGSLAMGGLPLREFEHENASVLLNESHWEFTLRINITQVCHPSPSNPVVKYWPVDCIMSISLDGAIIAIEYDVPPCGADPSTTTTTETTTPVGINPLHALGIGAGIGALVVIVIFYVNKQR
ncbi:MAG: hypothetical protein ACQET3_09490 [Promethearchaeati archaeon]